MDNEQVLGRDRVDNEQVRVNYSSLAFNKYWQEPERAFRLGQDGS